MTDHQNQEAWGYDLTAGAAVRWADRGPADRILGPYPTRDAAESWQQRSSERNSAWDDDPDWNDDPDRDGPGGPGERAAGERR